MKSPSWLLSVVLFWGNGRRQESSVFAWESSKERFFLESLTLSSCGQSKKRKFYLGVNAHHTGKHRKTDSCPVFHPPPPIQTPDEYQAHQTLHLLQLSPTRDFIHNLNTHSVSEFRTLLSDPSAMWITRKSKVQHLKRAMSFYEQGVWFETHVRAGL